MKDLKIAALAALMTAAAAMPLLAGQRLCGNGLPPRLSGDAFSPVECSTTNKPAALLPDLPVRTSKDAKTNLRDLDGHWEGNVIHGLGRYELKVAIKTARNGKAELTLDITELQFHERLTDRLSLVPSKRRGAYEAVLTTTLAPEASLKGGAIIGASAPPDLSTSTAKAPAERQADLLFENGAAHRVLFSLKGKDELRLRAFSAIPGAPLQKFETILTRASSSPNH